MMRDDERKNKPVMTIEDFAEITRAEKMLKGESLTFRRIGEMNALSDPMLLTYSARRRSLLPIKREKNLSAMTFSKYGYVKVEPRAPIPVERQTIGNFIIKIKREKYSTGKPVKSGPKNALTLAGKKISFPTIGDEKMYSENENFFSTIKTPYTISTARKSLPTARGIKL